MIIFFIGPVKLSGYECSMPSQDRLGFHHRGNLSEHLLPQSLTQFSQGGAFSIGQPKATRDLIS